MKLSSKRRLALVLTVVLIVAAMATTAMAAERYFELSFSTVTDTDSTTSAASGAGKTSVYVTDFASNLHKVSMYVTIKSGDLLTRGGMSATGIGYCSDIYRFAPAAGVPLTLTAQAASGYGYMLGTWNP